MRIAAGLRLEESPLPPTPTLQALFARPAYLLKFLSVVVTTLRTLDAGLNAGGETSLASYHLRANAERRINARTEVGVKVDYDFFDRDISGAGGLDILRHLSETNRVGVAGLLSRRTRFGWSYGVRPFVKWAFESGAFSGDAMSYGTALAVVAGLSSRRRIGIGGRVSRDMENEARITPVLIVRWKLNDNWSTAQSPGGEFHLAESGYDTAPCVALSIEGRF